MEKRVKEIDWAHELEEKIETFYRDPENEEAENAVIYAMMGAMACGGFVIMPVKTPEEAVRQFDPDSIQVGDVIQSEEPLRFELISIENEDGTNSMPIFTSREKMEEAELFCSTLEIPMGGYVDQVIGLYNVKGIVINPSDHGFFIEIEMLERIKEFLRTHKMAKRTTSNKTVLEKPQGVPEGFTETVSEYIRDNMAGMVNRVWFTGMDDDGEKSWLFAVETDAENPDEVFGQIDQFVKTLGVAAMPIDYMVYEEGFWPGAELIYDGVSETDGGQMRS